MRLLAFILSLAFASASPPDFERPYCDFLLIAREIIKDKQADRLAVAELIRTSDPYWDVDPTIKVVERIDVYNERGSRFVIKKIEGKVWGSGYAAEGFANQGDPRRFIKLAGRDVGRFFGYEVIDENTVTVPSVRRFNWAVDQINSWKLKEKIDLTFFESDTVLPNESFLKKFAEKIALPINAYLDGNYRCDTILSHDHTFHTGAILLPNGILDLARRQIAAIFEFHEFIKQTKPELLKVWAIRRFFEKHHARLAVAIDFGTGNFTANFEQAKLKPEQVTTAMKEAYAFGFSVLAADGLSPKDYIKRMLTKKLPLGAKTHVWAYDFQPSLFWAKNLRALQERADAFVASRAGDPDFNRGLALDENAFTAALSLRIRRIEAAIRLHSLKTP